MDDSENNVDEARRSALLRMGRFAAYTAPVMTTLLVAGRAEAVTSGGGCRGVGASGKCSNPNPHFDNNENPVHGN